MAGRNEAAVVGSEPAGDRRQAAAEANRASNAASADQALHRKQPEELPRLQRFAFSKEKKMINRLKGFCSTQAVFEKFTPRNCFELILLISNCEKLQVPFRFQVLGITNQANESP